jgi:non-ribosomal peptide synthetase component F
VFGTVVSGRPADIAGAESIAGLFINTLPVRVQAPPNASLLPWLKTLQDQQVEMRRYEYSHLVQVQGWSGAPRDLPLFESIYAFENYPVEAPVSGRELSVDVRDYHVVEKVNYPLTMVAGPGQELTLKILYDCRRFDHATITRLLGHLQTLLQGMLADPERRLLDLALLTEAEQQQLVVEWNATKTDYPQDRPIQELFEAQAVRSPDAVATVFGDQQLTYKELNCRANQLAHHLRTLGVGPEALVGVFMERSLEMMVGVLGILKAGSRGRLCAIGP